MNRQEIMQKAIRHYGIDSQLIKMQEECGELITAISKYFIAAREDNPETWVEMTENVREEIADVNIMIQQMKRYGGLNTARINEIEEYKLKRLQKRLEDV